MSGPWIDSAVHPTALLIDHTEHPRMCDATEEARGLLHGWCFSCDVTPGRPRRMTLSLCGDPGCALGEHHDDDFCLRDFYVWRFEPKHRCGT